MAATGSMRQDLEDRTDLPGHEFVVAEAEKVSFEIATDRRSGKAAADNLQVA
ncbi:hypothetical protein [Stappia indica]|uniref:hypothetical protein n=1 Tax=Stappia indica TaxID=538381 RepID=UPI00159647D3|nr:hypothetical protein [Stappia indica]